MAERIPYLLFVLACLIGAFVLGVTVAGFSLFPYGVMRDAYVTANNLLDRVSRGENANVELEGFSELEAPAAVRARFDPGAGSFSEPVLVYGGMHQFRELCPEAGCLAVTLGEGDQPLHAYPYRPAEIFSMAPVEAHAFESFDSDFASIAHPVGIERYENGDLLVVFHGSSIFPFALGAARVDRDGRPLWFRADYSHHWPKILADGHALIPAMEIGDGSIEVELHPDQRFTVDCASGSPHRDSVRLLDGEGNVVHEWSVLDAVLRSPYRAVLQHTTDACDPLHLNYVDVVDEEAAATVEDVDAGDLIVSLRNVSAFGFLDADDGSLKRLVRGTFFQQHSVQHWRDGEFLIFDNQGGGSTGGPSRLLAVDLATGKQRTVFPDVRRPDHDQDVFSNKGGKIDLSPDRERAIVAFSQAGKAVEVALEDGTVIAAYRHLHDLAAVDSLPDDERERAAIMRLYGVAPSRERTRCRRADGRSQRLSGTRREPVRARPTPCPTEGSNIPCEVRIAAPEPRNPDRRDPGFVVSRHVHRQPRRFARRAQAAGAEPLAPPPLDHLRTDVPGPVAAGHDPRPLDRALLPG